MPDEQPKKTALQVKQFLGSDTDKVTMEEFKAFWESCSDEEKSEFKNSIPDTEPPEPQFQKIKG